MWFTELSFSTTKAIHQFWPYQCLKYLHLQVKGLPLLSVFVTSIFTTKLFPPNEQPFCLNGNDILSSNRFALSWCSCLRCWTRAWRRSTPTRLRSRTMLSGRRSLRLITAPRLETINVSLLGWLHINFIDAFDFSLSVLSRDGPLLPNNNTKLQNNWYCSLFWQME